MRASQTAGVRLISSSFKTMFGRILPFGSRSG